MSVTRLPAWQWAVVGIAIVLSALAAAELRRLELDADIYALLGKDDPELAIYRDLEAELPELDALVVVCAADVYPDRELLGDLGEMPGIAGDSTVFVRPGKTSAYAFALDVDAGDYRETRTIVGKFADHLGEAGLDCGLTGTPAVVSESQAIVNRDLAHALGIAAVLVLGLFAFVYRIGLVAVLLLVPVGLGIGWGLAAFSMLRGDLTLLAATVPTLLIGIGIDHCIHLVQGVRHSIASKALDRLAAVKQTWRGLLRPISLATLTTFVAFGALTVSELEGLADLGWSGMLITATVYLSCMALMPLILLHSPEATLRRTLPLQSLMRAIARMADEKARLIVPLILALTVAAGLAATRLEPLGDNRELEVGDLSSRAWQARLAADHGLTPTPLLVVFDSPDDAIEVLAASERPVTVSNVLSVTQVPGMLQVHATDNPFEGENYRALVESIREWTAAAGTGSYRLTGGPALNARLHALVSSDARRTLPLAIVLIVVVLAIVNRSAGMPFVILTPLAISTVWLLGAMSVLGVPFSLMTLAIVPLVLGIGVDSSVHLVASWRRQQGDLATVFAESGLAIFVSSLTSALAFAAFAASTSPALLQFGWQAALALVACLAVTLLFLPPLVRRLVRI